jgi:membrane-associated phospholipid phosphatase
MIEDGLAVPATSPWRQRWIEILLGFGLAFLAGYISAKVTVSTGDWNTGLPWERSLMFWIHGSIPPVIDPFMLIFPWFGTNISLIPGIAVIVWWLWKRQHAPNYAMRLAVVQLGSYLLNPSLKAMFDRARPDLFERRGWYGWSSYPSGHAIASISVLITLAIILHRVKGWTWPYYVFIPIMLASLYSRIYLGVHWPTDVFAGMAVGVVWLLVTMWAFRDRKAPVSRGASEDRREFGGVDIATADDGGNPLTLTHRNSAGEQRADAGRAGRFGEQLGGRK